jgi:hypothetical protein
MPRSAATPATWRSISDGKTILPAVNSSGGHSEMCRSSLVTSGGCLRLSAYASISRSSLVRAFTAIEQVIHWDRFTATVAEAAERAPSDDFDFLDQMDVQYTAIRRWAPTFLAVFDFKAAPTTRARRTSSGNMVVSSPSHCYFQLHPGATSFRSL